MVTKKQAEDRCRNYLDHLHDVFLYLSAFQQVQAHSPTIRQSCAASADALGALRRKAKGFPAFVVSLKPNWEIPIQPCPVHGVQGATKLVVGGEISVGVGPNLVQSIMVGLLLESQESIPAANNKQAERLNSGDRVLIRRFHFDYDTGLANGNWPKSHLQYGGKFAASYLAEPGVAYRLYSVDVPRIPFPPFDLVLTLDFFLRQFQTPLTNMVEEARWLNLVKASESLWLRGYFREASEHLMPNHRQTTLYKRLANYIDWPH